MDADYHPSVRMVISFSRKRLVEAKTSALHNDYVDGSLTTPDMAKLTRAIVAGDSVAFEHFFELYSGRLYRFMLLLARGNEITAREVTQTVMIKLARKLRVFRTDADLWAWVSQVARNAFIDFVREQACRSRTALVEPLWPKVGNSVPPENPMLLWLEESLQSLTPDERELLEAVYFEHRSQRDCAEASGTTQKAIESKLARIRARLRQLILRRMKNEY